MTRPRKFHAGRSRNSQPQPSAAPIARPPPIFSSSDQEAGDDKKTNLYEPIEASGSRDRRQGRRLHREREREERYIDSEGNDIEANEENGEMAPTESVVTNTNDNTDITDNRAGSPELSSPKPVKHSQKSSEVSKVKLNQLHLDQAIKTNKLYNDLVQFVKSHSDMTLDDLKSTQQTLTDLLHTANERRNSIMGTIAVLTKIDKAMAEDRVKVKQKQFEREKRAKETNAIQKDHNSSESGDLIKPEVSESDAEADSKIHSRRNSAKNGYVTKEGSLELSNDSQREASVGAHASEPSSQVSSNLDSLTNTLHTIREITPGSKIDKELADDPSKVQDMTDIQAYKSPADSPPEYEKNPKSEFVESQTLPLSLFNLFDEKKLSLSLPTTGQEFLKQKYGVASYPTVDLQELLPGKIPDQDFTRAKPSNQVQFSTFAAAMEPYLRPFTEDDISCLMQKHVPLADGNPLISTDANLSPYIIPNLGPLYTDVWSEEDASNGVSLGKYVSPAQPPRPSKQDVDPRGSEESLADNILETDEISCGPLASRLLSALLKEGGDDTLNMAKVNHNSESKWERFDSEAPNDTRGKRVKVEDGVKIKDERDLDKEDDNKSGAENGKDGNESENDDMTGISPLIDSQWKVTSIKGDYATLEQRLKREFKYVGIVDVSVLKNLQNAGDDGLVNGNNGPGAQDIDAASALKKASRKRKRNIIKAESSDEGESGDDSSRTNSNSGINGSSVTGETGESLSDFEIDFVRHRQDDEICRELRALQQKLRQTTKLNQARKNRLLPVLREQLAWQEYSSILDDLDKQVDQAYTKRLRNAPKGKKKKGIASTTIAGSGNIGGASGAAAGSSVSSGLAGVANNERAGLRQLLEKRKRWIEKIGPVFRDPQVMKRIPKESVFDGLDKEIENDDMDDLMADNESADEENGVFS